jgi:DNA-binding transcriptional regulator YdaS (Cro superfamily)
MKLTDYLESHGVAAVSMAEKIGCHASYLSQMVTGKRPFAAEYCVAIEKATAGEVTRQELRPDDFWKIWPDLAHLAPATLVHPMGSMGEAV